MKSPAAEKVGWQSRMPHASHLIPQTSLCIHCLGAPLCKPLSALVVEFFYYKGTRSSSLTQREHQMNVLRFTLCHLDWSHRYCTCFRMGSRNCSLRARLEIRSTFILCLHAEPVDACLLSLLLWYSIIESVILR